MSNPRPLDVIQISNPCAADWDQMPGDDKRRLCTRCGKFVHNLSQMSTIEAERVVCESSGSLCVRFSRDPTTDQMLTLNYAAAPKVSRRCAMMTIASILAAMGFAGGRTYALLRKKPTTTTRVVMGKIAMRPVFQK